MARVCLLGIPDSDKEALTRAIQGFGYTAVRAHEAEVCIIGHEALLSYELLRPGAMAGVLAWKIPCPVHARCMGTLGLEELDDSFRWAIRGAAMRGRLLTGEQPMTTTEGQAEDVLLRSVLDCAVELTRVSLPGVAIFKEYGVDDIRVHVDPAHAIQTMREALLHCAHQTQSLVVRVTHDEALQATVDILGHQEGQPRRAEHRLRVAARAKTVEGSDWALHR